eukprot:CAMPEP_0180634482 /NCGR_PEP_ID=MMETSP1037_2-20121125/42155_1 /TAXON_ID=632150 /ORGANISM="Azadinium spinosum, Strain 3D9" /LENGTH=579 /DNA_ID=CAMNT_0022655627 /DNA_START=52 /DNA_END=1791 /DNA_ORIENTATION=-
MVACRYLVLIASLTLVASYVGDNHDDACAFVQTQTQVRRVDLSAGVNFMRELPQALESLLRNILEPKVGPEMTDQIVDIATPEVIQGFMKGDITDALVDMCKGVPAPSPLPFRDGELLLTHPLKYCNTVAIVMVVVIIAVSALGHILDRNGFWPWKSRPLGWAVFLLLLVSYAIWFPVLFYRDFSINLGVRLPGGDLRIGLTLNEHNDYKPGPWVESTRSFIKLLWDTGCPTGSVLMAIYAFFVPVLKLACIIVGEVYRCSEEKSLVRRSRRSLLFMRMISKWAAPDMIVISLFYHLVREMNKLPIEALVSLDVGFTCYCLFVILCAITSAMYPIPEIPEDEDSTPPMSVRFCGTKQLFAATCISGTIWAALFVVAIISPVFGMSLSEESLRAHLDPSMAFALDLIDLGKLAPPTSVSMLSSATGLANHLHEEPDLNILLAFVMLMCLSIVVTFLSMVAALMVALQTRDSSFDSEQMAIDMRPWRISALPFLRWLDHLAMLDVSCMGVILVWICGSMYKDYGMNIYSLWGFWFMIASEVVRHFIVWHVESAAEYHLRTLSKDQHSPVTSQATSSKACQR